MDTEARLAAVEERLRQANETIRAQKYEIGGLKAKLEDGNQGEQEWWLQMKVNAQKDALRRLNQRVVNQRFVLSKINSLGRGLSKEEWLSYKGERDYITEDDSLLVG